MDIYNTLSLRYIFSKKSTNAINIITTICIIGITIGTAALIIILSVFNGFGDLLASYVNDFNPDLKVSAEQGKYLEIEAEDMASLATIEGIELISTVIEETALFEYEDATQAGVVLGVDNLYGEVTNIRSILLNGEFDSQDKNRAIAGLGLARLLNIDIGDPLKYLTIYVPKIKRSAAIGKDFRDVDIQPTGIFSLQNEKDNTHLILDIGVLKKLLQLDHKISYLAVKISADADEEHVREAMKNTLSQGLLIQNKYQQEESLFKVMNIEKWVSFLIIGVTLLLTAFNLVGSLWMIVLEKKRDISVMHALGMTRQKIGQIFLHQGLLITSIGVICGLLLAILVYVLQTQFGLVKMQGNFIIDAYPIKMKLLDVLVVIFYVFIIGYIASIFPARKAKNIPTIIRAE